MEKTCKAGLWPRRRGICYSRLPAVVLALAVALILPAPKSHADEAAPKLAVLSTSFVLPAKFRMMAAAAAEEGVNLDWQHVDTASPQALAATLQGADMLVIDAPRDTDIASVEAAAGDAIRASGLPGVRVSVMNSIGNESFGAMAPEVADQIFGYWVAGTAENHRNLARFAAAWVRGEDLAALPAPVDLPNGGIYHPQADRVFADLPAYLAWWEGAHGSSYQRPVIAMEFSSSYISDGQTRMLDDIISAIEARGAVPLSFYRASRLARTGGESRNDANGAAAQARGGRPERATPPTGAARPVAASGQPSGTGTPQDAGRPAAARQVQTEVPSPEFPNPQAYDRAVTAEPLVTLYGRTLPDVLLVNTFIGGNPDGRKAWLQTLGIPVIHLMSYRDGDRTAYLADHAGIDAFSLPFTLTSAEYIGLQDPVLLSSVEQGVITPMPEQLDLAIDKAMRLASLRHRPNAEKRVAMVYWNTPAGETNMGGSNLNLPRSMVDLAEAMRAAGYKVDPFTEEEIIERAHRMMAPRYRLAAMEQLTASDDWVFLPMRAYRTWFDALPETVRQRISGYWGAPEKSQWLTERDGEPGFVIPRLQLGNLTILPQPPRGYIVMPGMDEMEHALFHDDAVPVNHAYLAAYLWLRQNEDALIHFGTHGSQEWTPGKERGLWAYDDPQLLAGDVPILYPYIVDNIGEAVHVKRRGRGVIVSYQTPAFAPAGLSPDLTALNDLFREYHSTVEGPARTALRQKITEKAVAAGFDKDLGLPEGALLADFAASSRALETLLEDLGSQMQPLGLHRFGSGPDTPLSMAANVMQMMGAPFYAALGVDPAEVFKTDSENLGATVPMQFVTRHVLGDEPASPSLEPWVQKGRGFRDMLDGKAEIAAVLTGLSGGWIDPSFGGDPIRNPDALPTGRNIYGFDPARIPTRNAYAEGQKAIEELIVSHTAEHGAAPKKLAFTMWSTETMRHLGMLEAQILAAMGVRPVWDEGGRVTGIEVIPLEQLGRPRIDPVISITGLYRDQFPNVMERLNEAIVAVNALDESPAQNPLRANTARIADALRAAGVPGGLAETYALTRLFGNESGNYGTGLPDAVMRSREWEEEDGQLANGYLNRMGWAYGPDTSLWSQRLGDGTPEAVNAFSMQLHGTDAAVFSRSSNLRGLLDTDHPFEYLGGLSLAIRKIDGASPRLYISNMRDPNRTKLQSAEGFMASELRAVYQHPRWVAEMKDEGFAGTLALLKTVNNFWGWQTMDRNIVRDDQWREFMAVYVEDRYALGVREWFEQTNPQAMAQITERMIEAIRKDYWQASEEDLRKLIEVYTEVAQAHNVVSDNSAFSSFVEQQALGFGITLAALRAPTEPEAGPPPETVPPEPVTGQELRAKEAQPSPPAPPQYYALIPLALIGFGFLWQSVALMRRQGHLAGDLA